MAIYEYRCKQCENRFDLMRRVAERDKPAVCPACGSRRTARAVVQAFAVMSGAKPDAAGGEGESEDFLDGHGHDHDHGLGLDDDDFDL
ncbi:MAG: zinc ribbon domain-containing protein [Chloroflexi bacterium]|nr:zinc ribbon domain-containing protein [Chloroflexota bacterium]